VADLKKSYERFNSRGADSGAAVFIAAALTLALVMVMIAISSYTV
jgi:hypothetical protein